MEIAAADEEFKSPKTIFKLINPGGNPFGGGQLDRFKPAGAMGVNLVMTKPAAATPTTAPVQPTQAKFQTAEPPDTDAKILARMESLLKIEKHVRELEEENDLLLKMVNRVKTENDALKAENDALKAK